MEVSGQLHALATLNRTRLPPQPLRRRLGGIQNHLHILEKKKNILEKEKNILEKRKNILALNHVTLIVQPIAKSLYTLSYPSSSVT
jgi:hypothetical protein